MRSIVLTIQPDGSVSIDAKKITGLVPGKYHAVLIFGEQVPPRSQARVYVWSKVASPEIQELLRTQKAYSCSALGGVREGRVFDFKPGGFSPPEAFLDDVNTMAKVLTDPATTECEFEVLAF